jgi:hypothetical protein
MIVKLTELTEDATIICEMGNPFQPIDDTNAIKDALYAIHDQVKGPVTLIALANTEIGVSFSDIMMSIATATRGVRRLNALPLTVYTIAEQNNAAIKVFVEAFSKSAGDILNINTKIAPTLNDALVMIRADK